MTQERTPKYEQIAELIRRRIGRGDYCSGSLPGAPKLAQELGVSYMTARQAMRSLIEHGDVIQAENGRLTVPEAPSGVPKLRVAFIHPGAPNENKWYRAIQGAARKYQCSYRDIQYLYSDDAVIFEALDGEFDLIFIQLAGFSPVLLGKLIRNRERVVSLFTDLTRHGIRCFDGLTFDAIGPLLQLLSMRGCRTVDFFDTVPNENPKQVVWQRELRNLGMTGNAYGSTPRLPMPSREYSREFLDRLIAEGRLKNTDALFCGSMPVARGAIRALTDHGIRVPEDMAVVSFGNPEEAVLNTPSVTVVNTPELSPLVDQIYEHYLGICPAPKRMFYRFELSDVAPEKLILYGESVANYYGTEK